MATESRLADIYRQELKKSGLLGALLSASGARMKEKTDIRRMLPQSGISGAAFEKMFGKAYKYGANKGGGVRDTKGGGDGVSKSMEEKLTRIGVDSKLTAKNTVVLPAMARDMNVMRLNMQKMVKLAGGTATKSSDMFFKRASDRESQYESQYKRNSGGLAPTPVAGKKEGGGFLGMLGSLLGGAKDIVSAFGGFFKGLFGVILASGIIGQFLQDPETRANFLDFITKFLKAFFDGVKNTFEVVGEALKDKDVQASIAGAIKAIFNAILEVFKVELTKIETPFGDLSVTIGDVLLAFVGFKAAMFALETAILLRAANIGRGGGMPLPGGTGVPGGPDGPDKGKGGKGKGGFFNKLKDIGSKTGKYGLYGMGAYGAYEGYNAVFGDDNAVSNETDVVPADSVSEKNLGLNTDTALAVGGTALGTAGLAYSASQIKKTLTPTPISIPEAKPGFLMSATDKIQARAATEVKTSSRWGRFLAFVAKKSPALAARLGVKLAAMAGMATIPVAGWISALFTLGFAASDIYAIYSLWCEFTGTDEEKANPEVNDAVSTATPVVEAASVSPPAASAVPTTNTQTGVMGRYGFKAPIRPGQQIVKGSESVTPAVDGSGGAAFGMYPKPGGKNPLLAMISKAESASSGGYNAMNQGTIDPKTGKSSKNGKVIGSGDSQKIIKKKLTDMTVGQIMALDATKENDGEKRKQKGLIFAAGAYQIIPSTLEGLVKEGIVSSSDKFDEATQDKLGMALIEKTGALRLAAEGKFDAAQNVMAQTWAGIALATDLGSKKAGESYYGGPGNKALANLDVKGALMASLPSSGVTLASASTSVADQKFALMSGSNGTTIINAPVTNTLASSSGGGGNNNMNPYDSELMKYLLKPVT